MRQTLTKVSKSFHERKNFQQISFAFWNCEFIGYCNTKRNSRQKGIPIKMVYFAFLLRFLYYFNICNLQINFTEHQMKKREKIHLIFFKRESTKCNGDRRHRCSSIQHIQYFYSYKTYANWKNVLNRWAFVFFFYQ